MAPKRKNLPSPDAPASVKRNCTSSLSETNAKRPRGVSSGTDCWSNLPSEHRKQMCDDLQVVKCRLEEATKFQVECLPRHFLALAFGRVDIQKVKLPALCGSMICSLLCVFATERVDAVVQSVLDFFDSILLSSPVLIFYLTVLCWLCFSYTDLKDLFAASGSERFADALKIDFRKLRCNTEMFLLWWGKVPSQQLGLTKNVNHCIEKLELLVREIRHAQAIMQRKQQDALQKADACAAFGALGIVGLFGFVIAFLCSIQIGRGAVLPSHTIGITLAGGTVAISKGFRDRLKRSFNSLQVLNNDLVALAVKLNVRRNILAATLTAQTLEA